MFKNIAAMQLRKKHGVTILLIQRQDGSTLPNPGGEERLQPGDRIVLMGRPADTGRISRLLSSRHVHDEKMP